MIYPDGNHKGEILSPYLQKKAIDLVLSTQEKSEFNALKFRNKINLLEKEVNRLTRQNKSIISKHKSLAIKIQKCIIKKVKENKRIYTPEFITLLIQISNTGQILLSSGFSKIAELKIIENLPNMISQFASYVIMADKTTKAATVSSSVRKTINSYLLNPIKC
ncbi:hypothetical protein RhiirA4_481106 [Rhizophagus irregularis]|uniref:Uncharacterized protein n=1 Tax=Rhizophagus irregularis TaxID=588596 RepID=A0A2I1HIZ4_9GLOM|nr:hypothetical protein RhiirA4_481106 [Rhizophagus irregularis]